MLQECHCTENTNPVWSAEWEYQAIFSTFSSNKAGVCILFNNTFNLQIQKLFVDPSGRFIICDIQANSNSLTLTNIYAPNEDSPAFFLIFLTISQTLIAMTLLLVRRRLQSSTGFREGQKRWPVQNTSKQR